MRKHTVREVDATPYAASLIEGHRDFGYSLETALADIIDNAITAGAQKVELVADTVAEEPWIALADDGSGMSEIELIEAMRLGSKNPTDKRAAEDLGRFGLGLKSASFSQCRSLTVLTRRDATASCARWDLDRVAKRNDWSLELIDNPELVIGHDLLPQRGTVVIWKKLDRLSGGYNHDRSKCTAHMNAELSRAERHLRLVFHRFLEGARRLRTGDVLNLRGFNLTSEWRGHPPQTLTCFPLRHFGFGKYCSICGRRFPTTPGGRGRSPASPSGVPAGACPAQLSSGSGSAHT